MGVMDKFLNLMKIGDDNDDDDYYNEEDDGYVEKPKAVEREPEKPAEEKVVKPFERKQAPAKKKVTGMNNDSTVCVFKPTSHEEARGICETLLEGKIVVLNFEGVKDIATSQRVLDIVTGTCIAIGGNLQKMSNYIFIATPASVEVSGGFLEDTTGSFDTL